MRRAHGFVAAGLGVALLLGCASPPRTERTVLAGSAGQDLLVLPFNVAVATPPELEDLRPYVWHELELYLRAQGKRLRTVSYRDARQLWLESIREVRTGPNGARAGYDEASRVLVRKLRTHADFDTLIAPSLFVREAPVSGKIATWDGVERAVEFETRGSEARRIASETPLEGAAPAASLHAVVFDAKGEKIQEGQGGLDLLVRVRVMPVSHAGPAETSFEYAAHPDPFANRDHVREGIAVALAPFLPSLPADAK